MNPLKRLIELSRTGTFRLTAVFAVVFGIGSAVLLVVLNLVVSRFAEDEVRQALQHQIAIMRADVNLEGGDALANMLNEHNLQDEIGRYSYLVVTNDGKTFSNGLPAEIRHQVGFSEIRLPSKSVGKPVKEQTVMVLAEQTPDGTFMAVGRDTASLQQLHRGLNNVALWGSLGVVCFSIGAGAVFGSLFLRRLDHVNAAAARLIDSNLTERLPPIGFGSEFDTLAANLNRMLDRLEAAITAVKQVSADLAHDLRTPLTRLRNRLEDVSQAEPEHHRRLLDEAVEEVDEILRIFNALLRIAHIEGSDLRRGFQRIDLTQLVERVCDIYRPVVEDGGKTLFMEAEPGFFVKGDHALLQQMLSNLLDNAVTHTQNATAITVRLSRTNDSLALTVVDTGAGVPEAEFANVLKRFYRLDASRGTAGSGLGLPLVAAIAEAHSGKIALSDNHPGLAVTVSFPLTRSGG